MKLPFFIFLICNFFFFGLAQTNNDPVYLNYSFFPSRDMNKFDEKSPYHLVEANLILPGIKLGKNTKIYTNLNYKLGSYTFENESNKFPSTLNDFRLGFIVRQPISENWEVILAPRLNLRTDYKEDLTKRDLFPSVHLLGLRTSQKNPNLVYGMGISYNNEATKNLVIPLAFLQYKSENYRIFSIIPSFAYFLMTPNENLEYGLSVNLESGLFHIKRLDEKGFPNYFSSQNITIAPTLSYQFLPKLWFNFKAGYALPGKFQVLDADFEPLEIMKENKFKGGFILNFGTSFRVEDKN